MLYTLFTFSLSHQYSEKEILLSLSFTSNSGTGDSFRWLYAADCLRDITCGNMVGSSYRMRETQKCSKRASHQWLNFQLQNSQQFPGVPCVRLNYDYLRSE